MALLINLLRPPAAQRPTPATPSAGPGPAPAEPRVGVVIDADGLADLLPLEAIADRLAGEPTITAVSAVSKVTSGYIEQMVRGKELTRLVVGGQYIDWVRLVAASLGLGNGPNESRVRVIDVGRLCARVHGRREAAAKAFLLLAAAATRVRAPDAWSRAGVEEELRTLLTRRDVDLAPRVAVLACPTGYASLRMMGQIGGQYSPGALPVEVPCHLNRDPDLVASAFALGASAVLLVGCHSTCELGCPSAARRGDDALARYTLGEGGREGSLTVCRLGELAHALDLCLGRIR